MTWQKQPWFLTLVSELKEAISAAGDELKDGGKDILFLSIAQRVFRKQPDSLQQAVSKVAFRELLCYCNGSPDTLDEAYRLAPSLKRIQSAAKAAPLKQYIKFGPYDGLQDPRIEQEAFFNELINQVFKIPVD